MVRPWSTHHGQETSEMMVDHGQTMIDHARTWSHGQTAAREYIDCLAYHTQILSLDTSSSMIPRNCFGFFWPMD